MTEKNLKYLSDVLLAIEFIEDFLRNINSFKDYESDKKTQSAVERQLVIIGEALNHYRKSEQHPEISKDKQIVAFRNRLVHSYDSIDNSIVWVILEKHLKPLKEEIKLISKL